MDGWKRFRSVGAWFPRLDLGEDRIEGPGDSVAGRPGLLGSRSLASLTKPVWRRARKRLQVIENKGLTMTPKLFNLKELCRHQKREREASFPAGRLARQF